MDDHSSRDYPPSKSVRTEPCHPFVSMVVPFFSTSTEQLDRCIDALLAQEYPRDKLVIIIVDNNEQSLLGDCYRYSTVSLVVTHEPQPGSYRARNRGYCRPRRGLCFTDSDCIPAGDWISSGVRLLAVNAQLWPGGGSHCPDVQKDEPSGIVRNIRSVHQLKAGGVSPGVPFWSDCKPDGLFARI